MKHTLLITLVLVALAGTQGFAQTKNKKAAASTNSEILTNASVIDLYKAGLDKDVIISKIETSQTSFDLTTNGLIALKNQKVDNEVIKAMLNKSNGSTTITKETKKIATTSNVPDPDLINQLYFYDHPAGTIKPLEKSSAVMKTKTKMLGYGGASVVYTIDGDKSPVSLTAADSLKFIVNVGNSPIPDLSLYKLSIIKGTRQATTQKINSGFKGFSGSASEGGATIPFNVTLLKEGVYQFTPSKTLEKGEYFFATKPSLSASSVDVYAFGIN